MSRPKIFRSASVSILPLVLLIATLPSVGSASYPTAYQITAIPLAVDEANTLNHFGQIAGNPTVEDIGSHAFIFDSAGLHDLGSGGADLSHANGINNNGEVVGFIEFQSSDNPLAAALYTPASNQFKDLNTLIPPDSGWHLQQGKCINDSGQITGHGIRNGVVRGFLYSNGNVSDIGTLGGEWSGANAINNLGQIVGSSVRADGEEHAFRYDVNNGMTDLGTLGGNQSEAISINDFGHVVGYSPDASFVQRAFLYDGSSIRDLGTLDGAISNTVALDINNLDQIVGTSAGRAFLYEDGTMYDLNHFLLPGSGWILNDARSINDAGQIIGLGEYNGQPSWFLLTPTSTTSIGSNVTVQANTASLTFSNVLATGNTTVAPILPISAGTIPGGYELAGANLAYEITTTATVSGSITIGFKVPTVNDAGIFNSLRVLHNENGTLVDRTILPPDSPSHDFATRTVYARVDSLSPFVIARVGYNVCPLYDQTKAYRSGNTIPIRLQICDGQGNNLSSAGIQVVATSVSLASTNAPGVLEDSGNANPDFNFRYTSDLVGGGYIFNLNTRGYGTGTYNLHLRAGSDPILHVVQFQVR